MRVQYRYQRQFNMKWVCKRCDMIYVKHTFNRMDWMRCLLCNARFVVTKEEQVKCTCAVQMCNGCGNTLSSCITEEERCPWCKTHTEWYIVPPGFFASI